VIERKANTYRLYPTPDQAQQMALAVSSTIWRWNSGATGGNRVGRSTLPANAAK
jgi:hypothetical protein